MNHLTNDRGSRPSLQAALLVLLVPAIHGVTPAPAYAHVQESEEVRIAVTGADFLNPRSVARLRREADIAAEALCNSGGVASIYRGGARRCRERIARNIERQLRHRRAIRLSGLTR